MHARTSRSVGALHSDGGWRDLLQRACGRRQEAHDHVRGERGEAEEAEQDRDAVGPPGRLSGGRSGRDRRCSVRRGSGAGTGRAGTGPALDVNKLGFNWLPGGRARAWTAVAKALILASFH
jgi:hypothetical protein